MFSFQGAGRVGRIECKATQGGTIVCSGSIATNRKTKDGEQTDWMNFKSFGKTAEVMGDHVKPGSFIIISGTLQIESWTGKDGNPQSKPVVMIDRFAFGPKSSGDQPRQDQTRTEAKSFGDFASKPSASQSAFSDVAFDDSELPF